MTVRSLRASPDGIEKAKKALLRNSLNKKALAEELGKSRATVQNFFNGTPVDRQNFIEICAHLGCCWKDIVASPPSEPEPAAVKEATSKNPDFVGREAAIAQGTRYAQSACSANANSTSENDLNALVQSVREKGRASIQKKYGMMRVLDMSQPIELSDIYISVNTLEKITGRRRLTEDDLLQGCNPENFDRLTLSRITDIRMPGLEAVKRYPKLMVLGKPGAGKTTFLKYLALQYTQEEFQAERALVPVFITLRDFAEAEGKPNLLEYVTQQFANCRSADIQLVEQLLNHGIILVLLDGLDEVRKEDDSRVFKQIRYFYDKFDDNHFVITCRIAAWEYNFEPFTEVEVADFDAQQISTFAHN